MPHYFTTAFDDYAIEAFKTHAVDYLLKPIDANALDKAIQKFKQYFAQNTPPQYLPSDLAQMMQLLAKTTAAPKTYRQRFLVVKGEEYISINATDIAYFYSENRITRIVRKDGKWFPIEPTLDDLEEELDPSVFFRINRQFIAQLSSIQKVSKYFNGKLKIDLSPKPQEDVTVSRDKAETFRNWLDS